MESTSVKGRVNEKINFIDSKFDKEKARWIDYEVEDFIEEDSRESHHPITAKRIFSDDNTKLKDAQVTIRSPELQRLLRDVLSLYLEHEFKSTFDKRDIVLSKPFVPLQYNWEQLRIATTDEKVREKYGHELVKELEELLGIVYRLAPEYTQMWNTIKDSKTVMKKYLHCMFKPGNLVVAIYPDKNVQLMKVRHYGAGSTENLDRTSSVFCEGFDWNGRKLERLIYEFSMPEMESTEQFKVQDLPCYPIEFYEDDNGANEIEKLKKKLIERGQTFEKICMSQCEEGETYKYQGKFLVEGGLRSTFSRTSLGLLDSDERKLLMKIGSFVTNAKKVVIDPRSFHEYGPRDVRNGRLLSQTRVTPCNCSLCISNKTKDWILGFGKPRVLEDVDDYALLPPRALGFALDHKLWGQFLIDGLQINVEDQEQVFENELIFPNGKNDENKSIVKNLIVNHKKHKFEHITDFVDSKGQGLVLLFHGPPGVGKTMTAETLAISCRRILLTVGIGDLGTSAERVEESLLKLFHLTIAWRGILLIDEADVFLDSRGSKGDVFPEQNAMVSVMLRLLEYFPGVLILTTNRVRSIDYAIMSRISYAIKFKELTTDHQKAVYKNFLDQAERKNTIGPGEKEKLVQMTKVFKENKKLNGRDIRTMFTTAQLLGNGKLTAENIKEVHEQQQNFKDDMKALYILAERASIVT